MKTPMQEPHYWQERAEETRAKAETFRIGEDWSASVLQRALLASRQQQWRSTMTTRLPMPIGTRIIAVRNFGSVTYGQLGIITGTAEERYSSTFRPVYLCRFANNVKIAAQPKEIDDFNHGYSLADLEKPDFRRVKADRAKAELSKRTK